MTNEPSVPADGPTTEDEPVLTLIKRIKENSIDPAVLTAEDRRRCVEVLWGEGYSVAETAQILKRGERTIHRDRSDLRTAHALHVHPEFAAQMAGELIRQAEGSVARLRRIAREAGASAMERAMAENFAFKIHLDMIGKLQSMGYLPRIPTGVVAQVVEGPGDLIPTLAQLAHRMNELDLVDQELGVRDPENQRRRRTIRELLEDGRTVAEIQQSIDHKEGN